jgi:dihydroorotate dehydrogenase (NAD+) catalytic subunit
MNELQITVCELVLRNPLVLASGIWGSSAETLIRLGRQGAGAVTAKSCSLQPREGHRNPTVLQWEGGVINAVGLSNPGAAQECDLLLAAREGLEPLGVPLIASVFGQSEAEFAACVATLAPAQPDFIELNISCPNVEDEFGRPFALDPGAAAGVTAAVRANYAGRLLVKLSPNAPDIAAVARAVAGAGADGITAVNTLGPGMLIDVRARTPVLANRVGGVSGAALGPIALRCVYDICAAVDIPVIGTGGVATGEQALQMIMAGATAVGIGTALWREGDLTFGRIAEEMRSIMQAEGITSLDEIRGCAHGL